MRETLRGKSGRAVARASRFFLQAGNAPCFSHAHTSDHRYKRRASVEEAALVQQIDVTIKERQNIFFDMEAYLPKKNG